MASGMPTTGMKLTSTVAIEIFSTVAIEGLIFVISMLAHRQRESIAIARRMVEKPDIFYPFKGLFRQRHERPQQQGSPYE